MMFCLVIVTVLLHLASGSSDFCVEDPCLPDNTYVLQSTERRTPNCPYINDRLCDAYISDGWYKGPAPMLKTCTQMNTCGTVFPVWMNGTDPTSQDGVVSRQACLSGPSSCCQKTYKIKVKRCDTFIAYCLRHLESCPERYCFGETGNCTVPTTTTTTDATTTLPSTKTPTITEKGKSTEGSDSKYPGTHPCGTNDQMKATQPFDRQRVFCLSLPVTIILVIFISFLIVMCGMMSVVIYRGGLFDRGTSKITFNEGDTKCIPVKMSIYEELVLSEEKKY